jgi:hypothetical protein
LDKAQIIDEIHFGSRRAQTQKLFGRKEKKIKKKGVGA